MLFEDFVREKLVHTTHEWIAYKAMTTLPDKWKQLFLKHVEKLLDGSRAPDKKFHDFTNHVFHPPSWGGAPDAALEWYAKMVSFLKQKKWSDAVYAAGVLSHYIADPYHPLHTGQTDEEAKIHKFFEFGTAKSLSKYDDIEIITNELISDVKKAVIDGGTFSHQYYFDTIELYDETKVENGHWEQGIPDELHGIISNLLSRAVSTVFQVWMGAFDEANASPPKVSLSLKALVMKIKMPVYFVKKWLVNRYMKNVTKKMMREIMKKGLPYNSIPPDDRLQIDVFFEMAEEGKLDMTKALESYEKRRGKKPKKVNLERLNKLSIGKSRRRARKKKAEERREKPEKRISKKTIEKSQEEKEIAAKGLSPDDPIEDAPEIGKKTAERLKKAGIHYIRDLLVADFSQIEKAGVRIRKYDFERWKIETKLMVDIPGLKVRDAVFLYGCGVKNKDDLQKISMDELKENLKKFLKTSRGKSYAKWVGEPTDDDIRRWKELVS